MNQPSFFDLIDRTKKLTAMGDPLVAFDKQIKWEEFRASKPCS